ncbi:MAG: alpha/beta hydrolase-fold protein [Bacteroidota bacterium]
MNGFTDGTWASGSTKEGMGILEKELLTEIIPLVNKKYRIKAGKENTAITGLSMGGGQAFVMGLNNLDVFGWVGQFSSGLLASAEFDMDDRITGFKDKIDAINGLSLLYIACGEDDSRYQGHLDLVGFLEENLVEHTWHHMPGGHQWLVWRTELNHFMKLVFKTGSQFP